MRLNKQCEEGSMLDFFLVLGQIPGTNFTLTFSEVLVIATLVGIASYAWIRGQEPQKPFLTVWDSLISYENVDFRLPSEWTHHKGAALPVSTYVAWLNRHWRITR